MRPPCEIATRYFLPMFRSLVAKDLIEKYDYTQIEVAEKLGTTQAAISQYLHSKRGYKGTEQFEAIFSRIRSAASDTAKRLAVEEIDSAEVTVIFCGLCRILREDAKTF